MRRRLLTILAALLMGCGASPAPYSGWETYGGGNDQLRYSSLTQINRDNVADLQVAWTYDSGDAIDGSQIQTNPIVVDGLLYGVNPQSKVFALDAATGEQVWRHTPAINGKPVSGRFTNRGLMYWSDGDDRRVYTGVDHVLVALDAKTGLPVEQFGGGKGWIDLREHLGRPPETLSVRYTTPGVVYQDLLILGNRLSEGLPSAPGDIRAFDARTGELRWTFHTIPRPGDEGYETWPPGAWEHTGGANSWAGMALDPKRGYVYVPTGSAAFDFWGGDRKGDNLFANSLLCLNAASGEKVWHFQFVKHDVWDRDLQAPPNLITVLRDGRPIDAVSQITKSGHVFVLDRDTGEPLFPMEEREYPASDVPGESLSKTQVLPLKPAAHARQRLTEEGLTNRTPEARRLAIERLRRVRSDGQFIPPSLQGTIVYPGFDGGGEWGGAAWDPETGLLYVNANEMAWILRLVERAQAGAGATGARLYQRHCAACHLDDRTGTPPDFPSLVDVGKRISRERMLEITAQGAGRMPGFAHLGDASLAAIVRFLRGGPDSVVSTQQEESPFVLPYAHDGYNRFLDHEGYPAIATPWGTLNAINLNTGEIEWTIPFGEYPELVEQGIRNTGSENYGGPIVTAAGLLFIGATNFDRKFHAYDKLTGELLWETTLPDASGNATPAMYQIDGRQFVVIAAGGGKSGASSGSKYVAFALPRS